MMVLERKEYSSVPNAIFWLMGAAVLTEESFLPNILILVKR